MALTYRDRGSSSTQFDIVSGTAVVGRLWKALLSITAGQGVRWHWTWRAGPGAGQGQNGTADTVDKAKIEIERQWRAWLDEVGLQEKKERASGRRQA